MMAVLDILTVFVIVVVSATLIGLLVFYFFHRKKNSLNLKLLLVKVARQDEEESEVAKRAETMVKEVNATEQLLSALAAVEHPFAFEVAVHHTGEEIHFYLAVPRARVNFAMREVQGVFPDSKVEEVEDYTIFSPTGAYTGAVLTLRDNYLLPLRTYRESEADTFAPVVSTLSKLDEAGEGAALQILVQPLDRGSHTKESIQHAIKELQRGEKLKDVLKTGLFTMRELKAFYKSARADKEKDERERGAVDEEAIKALQAKVAKPLFAVNIRLAVSAPAPDRAEDLLMSLAGSFSQFTSPVRNQLVPVKPRNIKKLLAQYAFRVFDEHQALILNTEEIASLFHLPTLSTDVPRIKWLKTKEAPPPNNLPPTGIVLGESVFRGDVRPVRMTDDDRRRHLYIIGQTGTGKSYLMLNLIAQDMRNGKGLCVIDPHGELVNQVLERVPQSRMDDVIVFDPGDVQRPLGINMLEYHLDRPEEKTFIVNEIQSIFNRLFDKETMGPMFEQYMRNSLLLLMEDAAAEPPTLMEVPRIFTDEAFRKRKLARISNPAVIDFWEKEAIRTSGEQGLSNMTPYITSKFGNFIANDYMRPIIGQTKSAFNFRDVMDNGKILLVNLSKGKIGDINSGLLGMIVTGRLLLAALSRENVPTEARRDFYLSIDEFQNYTTDSIAVILSEARKYRLDLVLAHQFIAQLEENIRDAVFGNVGSIAAFRVGVQDTELLEKQFAPEFAARDLIGVDNQNAFVKLLIDGQPSRPFNMRTIRAEKGSSEVREKLKELSRLTYGRDLADVEQDIYRRLRA